MEGRISLVNIAAGVLVAVVFGEPGEDAFEVLDGAVVAFVGERFEDGGGAEFSQTFEANGDAAMVVFIVIGAGDPERGNRREIAGEPGKAVGGGEGRGGGEYIGMAHGEIGRAGTAHGVAGEIDARGVNGVLFSDFIEDG